MRQCLSRLRKWLGADALRESNGAVMVRGDWRVDLSIASGEAVEPEDIAPELDHPAVDEIRERWARPAGGTSNAVTTLVATLHSVSTADPITGRSLLVAGQSILWDAGAKDVTELLNRLRPASRREPLTVDFLEFRGIVRSLRCRFDGALACLQGAYQLAKETKVADADRVAASALFVAVEAGLADEAIRWNSLVSRPANQLAYSALAAASYAWNQADYPTALNILRSANRLMADTDRASQLHYWSNLAVLAAEAGELTLAEEAADVCRDVRQLPGGSIMAINVKFAQSLVAIARRRPLEAKSILKGAMPEAERLGWVLTKVYNMDYLAIALGRLGDAAGARNHIEWSARRLQLGGARLNRRRLVLRARALASI